MDGTPATAPVTGAFAGTVGTAAVTTGAVVDGTTTATGAAVGGVVAATTATGAVVVVAAIGTTTGATVVATTSFVKTFVEGDRFAVRHRTLLLVVAHRRKEWHTSCGHSMENAWWLEHHDGFRFWRSTS